MEGLRDIGLSEIVLSKDNPRRHFNEEKIQELAKSIGEKGVISPILVRPVNGKYELVCGERRLKASKVAKLKDIPAIVRELTDGDALELQLIENLQRDDLNPIEEAQGFKALIDKCKYTQETLAKKIGKSQGFVAARLALLDVRDDYQADIISGGLTAGHLKYLMPLTGCDRILDGVRTEIKQAEQISVKEFHSAVDRVVERRARSMADAEFNKAECKECKFNKIHKTYYGQTRACFRPECYSKKQRAALKAKKQRIKDGMEKGKVANEAMMKAAVDLGGNQILFDKKTCKGCENKKIGYETDWQGKKVKKEVCVDKECFNKKNKVAEAALEKKKAAEFKKKIERVKGKAAKSKGERDFWVTWFAEKVGGVYHSDCDKALIAAYKLNAGKLRSKKAAAEYFTSNKELDLEEMFRFLTYWGD